MSIPAINHIISAVACTPPIGLIAQNPAFQKDLQAAHELFMRVLRETIRTGDMLCNLQTSFPQAHICAHYKKYLSQSLQLLKMDLEKIHNIIILLIDNPTPSLPVCVDFWIWAQWRFQLISTVQKNKG